MLTRRNALRLGLGVGIAGTVGVGNRSQALAHPGPHPPPPPLAHFRVPLPVPRVLRPVRRSRTTDYYAVVASRSRCEIAPGTSTAVLTYNGTFPGPTIKARSGRRVVVQHVNALDMPVSAHLHGGSNPVGSDGGMMDTIPPWGSKTYTYANDQPAATLWVHDHAHHMESEHVYRGLSSLYLLGDDAEDALGLPSGRHDVPLVLRDAHLDHEAQMVYTMDDAQNRTTILVNGKPWPYLRVAARKYRFRFVNSCNLRLFVLRLSDGAPFTVIGSDGGLLQRPFPTPIVVMSPGERLDVVLDFSGYPPGTQLVLNNLIGPGPVEQVGEVMRFDVGAPAVDTSRVPATLRTLPPVPSPTVHRTFTLQMDEPGAGHADHHGRRAYINGKVFDLARVDTTIAWGTTEHWTVTNASATIPHNFHLHLVQFRLLTRDGAPVDPTEAGFKDTVLLFPGQSVTLAATFDTHRGVFPYHCHMIDHSAMGMTAQMEIV